MNESAMSIRSRNVLPRSGSDRIRIAARPRPRTPRIPMGMRCVTHHKYEASATYLAVSFARIAVFMSFLSFASSGGGVSAVDDENRIEDVH
jgi:hypothetical protein